MQAFQADLARFESLHAQVLGVSPDTVETHRKFSEALGLHFPLIADRKGTIQKRYAPGRITYLIDSNGVIRFIQEGMPRNEDFFQALKRLRQ